MSASVPCQRRRAAAMVRSMIARSSREAAGRRRRRCDRSEIRGHRAAGFAQAVERIVARAEMTGGDAAEQLHQHGELARQDGVEHALLGVLQHRLEIALRGRDARATESSSAGTPAPIDQQARDHVEPFVAGGAGDAGKSRHRFAVGEDFLDDDVERLARAAARMRRTSCCSRRVYCAGSSSPSMWSSRSPCSRPSAISARDQLVHVAERPRVLDPQPGQIVDVEEAPVVDARHREPPVGEAVVLPLQQPMQRADAGLVVGAIGRRARAR